MQFEYTRFNYFYTKREFLLKIYEVLEQFYSLSSSLANMQIVKTRRDAAMHVLSLSYWMLTK